ncbi:von Willebrand factor A domain-containing protein 3B [Rhinatrema bivittatum]|uniref:von Willebrand factor A domain-containing protein 3B n=1 Tax=Rhinatrema bivittatum TaxID=194408 RepID=UPI001129E9B5|nr:von Willebrand factor A domain-containing protein 3B [Rhinatrema bivittatum]
MSPRASRWELDAQVLISSLQWLRLHGLKSNKLTFPQVMAQIGFQHKEDYVYALGRPVSSRYAEGLFPQYRTDDRAYNLTAKKEEVAQLVKSLAGFVELYKQRLDWLTSGSRQIFGVIPEHSIVIVADFGTMPMEQFDLCRDALSLVLKEQVSQIAKFNIIRAAEDLEKWQKSAVHATQHAIDSAVAWVWKLEYMPAFGGTGSCEAVLEAISDKTIEAVYYFAAGDAPESMKHLLLQKVSDSPCPVHTVSFNSQKSETLTFLKEISHLTAGRFHAFAERKRCKDIRFSSNSEENRESPMTLDEMKLRGGMPPGAGVREDVFLIWKELEEAKKILKEVQGIANESPLSSALEVALKNSHLVSQPKPDDFVSSKEWLRKHGLKVQKLTFYDALADCAFHHSEGVVDIKTKPENESVQTDAEIKKKLVNAKYCDKFVHAHWKDGSVVHVCISNEKYRRYEERMTAAIEEMERRVEWLQNGSRELFGTVLEDQVYILVDTSQSMKDKLSAVKDKILQLMQEQLKHKSKFNIVKFDSGIAAWQEKLAEVNEENLGHAWAWMKGLQVGSSTNILKALQFALADSGTQAVYLLTDGRPDQSSKTILAQIQLVRPIPVHTISFNCDDREANSFLYELSSVTGGRFHCYNSDLRDPEAPKPFVNEDVHLLMKEMEQGKKDLEKVQKLHAECLMLDWYHNGENNVKHKLVPAGDLKSLPGPHLTAEPMVISSQHPQHKGHSLRDNPSKPLQRKKALHAEQTKSSLLRILGHGVKLCEEGTGEWMLPETKELFHRNCLKAAAAFKAQYCQRHITPKKTKRKPKDSLDICSSRWLKTHGLAARRLTILDALAPTTVPHTAKYVPVLDKHVLSKVFDEVLPLAHVSGNRNLITLINPQAVNLENYKQKLVQVIKSYKRRLNLIIWRALSQEERDKFEQAEPIPYLENRETLLQALDRLGWPVSYEDVTLLEDEIQAGETYLQQASDLQQASKSDPRKLKEPQSNSEGENSKEESGRMKPKAKPRRKLLDTLKGQRAIARSEIDGFYYPGIVVKCISAKHALVDFSQGDTQITPTGFIIPTGGAVPCPALKVGDFVLARTGTQTGNICYVPAVVVATPRRTEAACKFYTVVKYNNRKKHALRSELIKISPAKFTFSCRYIQKAQMADHTIPNVQVVKHVPEPTPQQEEEGRMEEKSKGQKRNGRAEQKSREEEEEEVSSASEGEGDSFPKIQEHLKELAYLKAHRENCESGEEQNELIKQQMDLWQKLKTLIQKKGGAAVHLGRRQDLGEWRPATQKESGPDDSGSLPQRKKNDGGFLLHEEEFRSGRLAAEEDLVHTDESTVSMDRSSCRPNESLLIPGQLVLYRCPHNGWYHKGSIVHDCKDHTYFLQNNTGEVERIWREDIIADIDDTNKEIQEGDSVIAQYPPHPNFYCPGVVLRVMPELNLEVRYYDTVEALVPRELGYLIPMKKFEQEANYILECEERWIGQPVVARDDETGMFQLAKVMERVGDGKQYVIRWADDQMAVQNASGIFGKYSPSHVLYVGDHVLALAYPSSLTFLPGVIVGYSGTHLVVRFCNGESGRRSSSYDLQTHPASGVLNNHF